MGSFSDIFNTFVGALAVFEFIYVFRPHLPGPRAAALKSAVCAVRASLYAAVEDGLPDTIAYYHRFCGVEARAEQLLRRQSSNATDLWHEYIGFFAGRSWVLYMCTRDAGGLQKDIEHELSCKRLRAA